MGTCRECHSGHAPDRTRAGFGREYPKTIIYVGTASPSYSSLHDFCLTSLFPSYTLRSSTARLSDSVKGIGKEGVTMSEERFISRGFVGKRRGGEKKDRIPPGQYLTRDFPVLS